MTVLGLVAIEVLNPINDLQVAGLSFCMCTRNLMGG